MNNYTLKDKTVVVGVTGSVAAYKAAELVRLLKSSGADVYTILTKNAKKFVGEDLFFSLSGNRAYSSLFDDSQESMPHILLAKKADFLIVAPATASSLSKAALGFCDDLLSTTFLATKAKVIFAPAMNKNMWEHPSLQANLSILKDQGHVVVGPVWGEQACGDIGEGKMSEPSDIIQSLFKFTNEINDSLPSVLITTGSTREAIDPVRYLSNRSSGKMGFALAGAFRDLGARVTVIAGPNLLKHPEGLKIISVESTKQMLSAVLEEVRDHKIFISAAAVADYRAEEIQQKKLKKNDPSLTIKLVKNPDILQEVANLKTKLPYLVGFALETEDLFENAKKKLVTKCLNMVLANLVTKDFSPFGGDNNRITMIKKNGFRKDLGEASKISLSREIAGLILEDSYFNVH